MIYFAYMQKPTTIRFDTYNPRRNLPDKTGRKRGESNFLGAFERYLLENVYSCGAGGRYFSMANYGIADFVWLLPGRGANNAASAYLHSFETKLNNWRKAFQQAYRYSYFADAAFVVLPPAAGAIAQNYLSLFKEHSIGLWTFDPRARQLSQLFTPAKCSARNPEVRSKAVHAIESRVNLR